MAVDEMVDRIEVMRLTPEDVVIVTIEEAQRSEADLRAIRGYLEERFPGNKVLVVNGGARVGSVPKEDLVELLERLVRP